ncbi:endonuclease/exonuclease/phosphatase family protein, partial [Trifolium medium]|nr:endonuclease/exonuclease/phosphatase family protein [Trifolium medium]
ENMELKNEIFEDANDQGSVGTYDSDQERSSQHIFLSILQTVCTFKLLGYDSLVTSEVHGFAGGIAVAWQRDKITVYASPNEENRRLTWEELCGIANNMMKAWLVAGEFNDIAYAEEKRGGAIASLRRCSKFRERINARNLIDMGAMGPKFTWRGPIYHGGQRIYERLDRGIELYVTRCGG